MEPSGTGGEEATVEGLETRRLIGALESRLFGTDKAPVTIGRFEVVSRLGQGAMGTVYRARDPALDREIAVKVLAPRNYGTADGEESTERLQEEARALARLAPPNVLTVLDVGVCAGRPFIAMELVEGGTLLDWAARNPIGTPGRFDAALRLFREAAQGLAAAHRGGVIHRDIKPHNMLIDSDGTLRIADFGLARAVGIESSESTDGASSERASLKICGTPAYMAPEQYQGHTDERSDQFSLCATFWEVACGVRPFGGARVHELAVAIAESDPAAAAAGHGAPRWFQAVLRRGLSKKPEERFASIDTLLLALERGRRQTRRWLALGAVVVASGSFAAEALLDREPHRCAAAPTEIGEAWGPAQRGDLRQRFIDAASDGAAVFAETAPVLDAYAAAWSDSWIDACQATWVHATQSSAELDVRMRCLNRGRTEFVALVDALQTLPLDIARRGNVIDRVLARGAAPPCRDATAERDTVPWPDDPQQQATILALEARLAAAHAGFEGMSIDQMRQIVELEPQVEATQYPPLQLAWAYFAADYSVAMSDGRVVEVLQRALTIAESNGLWKDAVICASKLVDASDRARKGPDAAEFYFRKAESSLSRVADPEQQAEQRAYLAATRAAYLASTGQPHDALVSYATALAEHEQRFGPDSREVVRLLAELGQLQLKMARYQDARVSLMRALEISERSANLRLRQIQIRSALMRLSFELGDADNALRYARQCLADALDLGADHTANALAMRGNVAAALVAKGDREGAVAELRTAVAELAEVPDRENVQIEMRLNLAGISDDAPERARLTHKAHDLAVEHFGTDSYHYANALTGLARIAVAEGDPDAALRHQQEALAIFETLGRQRRVIDTGSAIATLLAERGEVEQAARVLAGVQRAANEVFGPDRPHPAAAELALAHVLHAQGDDTAARSALDRTRTAIGDQRDKQELLVQIEALRSRLSAGDR